MTAIALETNPNAAHTHTHTHTQTVTAFSLFLTNVFIFTPKRDGTLVSFSFAFG